MVARGERSLARPPGAWTAGGHRNPSVLGGDGQVTLLVRAQDPGAAAVQMDQHAGVRVAVVVAGADLDERDRGTDRVEKCLIGVGGAVMRNLQDVGSEPDAAGE